MGVILGVLGMLRYGGPPLGDLVIFVCSHMHMGRGLEKSKELRLRGPISLLLGERVFEGKAVK